MAFASFCGILTLQIGAAILAVTFFTLAAVAFAVNIFDYDYDFENKSPVSLILVLIFVVLLLVSGLLMFFSAYNEKRKLCLISVGVLVITLIYWLILSGFSFGNQPHHIKDVCVYQRCAESFWIADLSYRGKGPRKAVATVSDTLSDINVGEIPDQSKLLELEENKYLSKSQKKFRAHGRNKDDTEEDALADDVDDDDDKHSESNTYEFGLPMVGAIIFFVVNLIFLIFTIIIMWSYGKELQWAERFSADSTASGSLPNAGGQRAAKA